MKKSGKIKNLNLISLVLLTFVFVSFACDSLSNAASFQGLGDLPGGSFLSLAHGVSADGSVVVGRSTSTSSDPYEAFRWTASGGMQGLGDLPGGNFYSLAYGTSADGSVVVGVGSSASGGEAFRWTASGGMQGLLVGVAYAVSADGLIVVGHSISEAFRWTPAGGMQDLGVLPGDSSSTAFGISADGSVVVGTSERVGRMEAFWWTGYGGLQGLGDLPGGWECWSIARDVSPDGSVVVGLSFSDSGSEAFHWTESGGMVGLGDLPGGDFYSDAYAVSANGLVVVGQSRAVLERDQAFIWDVDNGIRNLKEVLEDNYGLDLTSWTLNCATGISDDGFTIVGYGTNPDGFTEAWRAVIAEDSDGDGLLDEWESDGIDYDNDGTIDLNLPEMGADSNHKDLFVEVDFLMGQTFPEAARNMVIDAFSAAPVNNPDNVNGITLHIMPNENNLPFTGVWATDSNGWAPVFDQLKDDRFGTVAERADSNTLAAKKLAFRYCIFANTIDDHSLGTAEIVGNDFFLTLGEFGGFLNDENLAAVFMHEFGHTLGLHHGGDDEIHGKPNYISVMNYALTVPLGFSRNFWKLDYSRVKLDILAEDSLNETLGITENGAASSLYQNVWMPFGIDVPDGSGGFIRDINLAQVNGTAVNWDGVGNAGNTSTFQDINYLGNNAPFAGVNEPSFPQDMNGHDDWANLRYAIGTTGEFADYTHNTVPQDKITEDILTWLNENVPQPCVPGDFDCDGDVDFVDFSILASQWLQSPGQPSADVAPEIPDGVVDTLDLAVLADHWLEGITP